MLRAGAFMLLAGAFIAVGCAGADSNRVDILAASSYTDVAEPLEALLEEELGLDIEFSFGSSGSFLQQIRQGAPASVVITADSATMHRMSDGGLVDSTVSIATNELVVVAANTAAGRAIESVMDLGSSDPLVVLCASSAPCGVATDAMLGGLDLNVDEASREPSVRATLTKVRLGEADAAIVYRTDALASPELRTVPIPQADNVQVISQAAAVVGREEAKRVLAVLAGPAALKVLAEAGFGSP
jgi:molybdate transport system substrate-binding protein